jgi:predicted flap endonuclease-1-like 5' DNA nuclease
MMLLLETYAVALIVALLIGIGVAYWAFRRGAVAAPRVIEATPIATLESPPLVQAPEPIAAEGLPVEAPLDVPVAAGPPDDLQILKGVGAKFAAKLNENGYTRFDQLASLTMGEVANLDDRMGPFKGRLLRDRVVEQAIFLARGDRAGFESAFGKLGSSGEALP